MNPLDYLNSQFQGMAPVAAMGIHAVAWDGDVLHLHAPIAANTNDKHSAFGGSLASIMTLAGWGLLTLKLQEAGITAPVFVADSHVRYLKPLYTDLQAEARLEPDVDWAHVLRSYHEHGKARAAVGACVRGPDDVLMSTLTGRFAALRSG